jgi:hypothetical protein
MNNIKIAGIGALIAWIISGGLFIAGCIGWVLNIVEIVHGGMEITPVLILRFVGIFVAPLGAVLGWI